MATKSLFRRPLVQSLVKRAYQLDGLIVRLLVMLYSLFTRTLRGLYRWVRVLLIGVLWLSFEGCIRAWKLLQPMFEALGQPVTNVKRSFFCALVSIVAGHLLLLLFTSARISFASLALWGLYGLMIHGYWERGARWCRIQLGIYPTRFDPQNPFGNLDLGN